jgi:hypothetical protein
MHVTVDGASIPVTAANRGVAAFQYIVPNTDNLLQYLGAQVPGAGWPTGNTPLGTVVAPVATDGYWVLINPLPLGAHTISFGATSTAGFSLNVTYNITVQ